MLGYKDTKKAIAQHCKNPISVENIFIKGGETPPLEEKTKTKGGETPPLAT